MSAIGGPVASVSVDGRLFAVAADADGNRDLGGFTNEKSPNGDGTARTLKTRKVWMMEGLSLEIDNDRNDLEYLQDTADSNDDVMIVFTFVDGNSYQGKGTITGDVKASSASATAPISFSGGGRLEKQ